MPMIPAELTPGMVIDALPLCVLCEDRKPRYLGYNQKFAVKLGAVSSAAMVGKSATFATSALVTLKTSVSRRRAVAFESADGKGSVFRLSVPAQLSYTHAGVPGDAT